MSAYKVGRTRQGDVVWWVAWQLPHGVPGVSDVRDATDIEAELMERFEWHRDTPGDRERLKTLLSEGPRT